VLLVVCCTVTPSPAQQPPAPTLLTAIASFYYVPDVHLSWSGADNSIGSSSYRVYRSALDTNTFQLIATTYYPGYNDFQLLGGQTYYYRVTSVVLRDTTAFESEPSSTVSAFAAAPGGGGGGRRHNHGTIAGRVVDGTSLKPLVSAQLGIFRVSSTGLPVEKALTDGSGHYKVALDTGSYIIRALPPASGGTAAQGYQPQWYNNATSPSGAERLEVADTSRLVADFALVRTTIAPKAVIRGMVSDSAGNPLKGALVAVLRTIQEMEQPSGSGDDVPGTGVESREIVGIGHAQGVVWEGNADSLGRYEAGAETGHAYIVLAAASGFAPQFFDHQPGPLTANILRIDGDTSGIDFNLGAVDAAAQFSVKGGVRDSAGVGVPSRVVLIPVRHRSSALSVRFVYTDTAGGFVFTRVRAGSYYALALPFSRFAPAYFRAGSIGVSRWQAADTIQVSGDVPGIDIGVRLVPFSGITRLEGLARSSGSPVAGVNVFASTDDGAIAGYGLSDDRGSFALDGIPLGRINLSGDLEGFQTAQSTVDVPAGSLSIPGADLTLTTATATSVPIQVGAPGTYALYQNYPNPFNPSTTIAYALPVASTVSLRVYNVLGQEVATLLNGSLAAGRHESVWNGKDGAGLAAASGIYFYRLEASAQDGSGARRVEIRKMIMVR
jgi:hypothetical protein